MGWTGWPSGRTASITATIAFQVFRLRPDSPSVRISASTRAPERTVATKTAVPASLWILISCWAETAGGNDKARVVEMRYFGGLSVEETAECLKVSPQTVLRDWKLAKAWLMREMKRSP